MGWDLSAFRTKSPVTSIDDLTEDDLVPLQRQQITTELAVIAKACDAQLDTNDPTWLIMQTDAYYACPGGLISWMHKWASTMCSPT